MIDNDMLITHMLFEVLQPYGPRKRGGVFLRLMVKNVMRTGNAEGRKVQDFYGKVETPYRLINNKVILPSPQEQERNPRSRSAKLRIAEKC